MLVGSALPECRTISRPVKPRRLRHILRGRDGNAIVEMAFGLPILFLVFTGIFWFSMTLYQKLQLAEAVSVGGRYLAIDRGDTDPCASTATKIYSAAPGLKEASMTLSFDINGVTTGASCAGASGSPNANMVSGGDAQITATYPCTLAFFPAFGKSPSTACSLTSTVEEIVQ